MEGKLSKNNSLHSNRQESPSRISRNHNYTGNENFLPLSTLKKIVSVYKADARYGCDSGNKLCIIDPEKI